MKALDDSKPNVRAAAALALGQMKVTSAVPKLQDSVKKEKEMPVVIASARALVDMEDPVGYAAYYAVLTGERKTGQSLMDQQTQNAEGSQENGCVRFSAGHRVCPLCRNGVWRVQSVNER